MVVRVGRAHAADWVKERLAGLAGTRWVGLDGLGAAGKTTLAGEIAAAVTGAVVVSVDDFGRADVRGWDRDLFSSAVIEPLQAGRPARYQRWDLLHDVGTDWVEVPPGGPVIVEGVSATDVRVPLSWDLVLWVDVPEDLRRARIAARDDPGLMVRWEHDWWPSEQAYAASQQPWLRADAIIADPG